MLRVVFRYWRQSPVSTTGKYFCLPCNLCYIFVDVVYWKVVVQIVLAYVATCRMYALSVWCAEVRAELMHLSYKMTGETYCANRFNLLFSRLTFVFLHTVDICGQ